MRNTPADERAGWGSYIRAARERRGLTQSALARLLKIDRVTVYRWEARQSRPENARTVVAVAYLLGLDVDEALAAAGLRPGEQERRPVPYDEAIELVLSDDRLDEDMKQRIIAIIRRRRKDELEETRRLIEDLAPRRDNGSRTDA